MSHRGSGEKPEVVYGIHAVKEAIRARPVEYVLVAEGQHNPRVQEIIDACRGAGISLRFAPRPALERAAGSVQHQNVVAVCALKAYDTLATLVTSSPAGAPRFSAAGPFDFAQGPEPKSRGERKPRGAGREAPLLVVLDGVEDPANLGAIIRTAVAAGSGGVVIPERRAAGLSPAVARAAAGALERARVARVTNLVRALLELKEYKIWVYGFEPQAEKSYLELDYTLGCALVLGGEGRGLHRLVREACDERAHIPLLGPVPSLNVSVAAGVVLYEAVRQRARKPGP